MKTLRYGITSACILLLAGIACAQVQLPSLNRQPTPDWVNVKTDVQPAAKGDGVADDTAALQAAFDKLEGGGGNPKVLYLPPGTYRITKTIQVTGADYTIAGTGYYSEFVWAGPEGGTLLHIEDPQDLTLSYFHVITHSVPRNMLSILQTSTGRPSSITYDCIMAGTHGDLYRTDRGKQVRGIEFRGLGANCRVHVKRVNGSGAFIDSAAANILLRFWNGGPIVVENPGRTPRTGFLGGLNANHVWELVVKDSSDIVFTEFYKEQGKYGFIQLYGAPGDPMGRVTLGAARLHQWKEAPYFAEIDGYRGQLTYAHANVTWDNSPETYLVRQKSASPFTLSLLAHDNFGFELQLDPSAKLVRGANNGVDDIMPDGGMASISAALDHWRLLGQKDVEFTNAKGVEKR